VNHLIIRKRKTKDFPSLIKITKNSFPGIRRIFCLLFPTLVAEKNSRVVGFVALSNNPKTGKIALIAVAKECRGQNIGEELLKKVFNCLKKERKKYCSAEVRVNNPEALRFFEKNGFKVQKIKKRIILDDVFLIKKELR